MSQESLTSSRQTTILISLGVTLILIVAALLTSLKDVSINPQVLSSLTSASPNPIPTPVSTPVSSSSGLPTAKVIRVVDGDTVELEGGQRVRYIGVNTPESVDPRRPVQCFGKEAAKRNQELVDGATVSLEKDVSETDKYGRLLRYVYKDGHMINEQLVREGFARVATYPPDVKYQSLFQAAEKDARENNRGLWSSCPR